MGALSTSELERRLNSLSSGLSSFPAESEASPPLVELFNSLLRQVKREVRYDPIIRKIPFLSAPGETGADGQTATAGALRTLTDQLTTALTGDGSGAEPGLSREEAKSKSKST